MSFRATKATACCLKPSLYRGPGTVFTSNGLIVRDPPSERRPPIRGPPVNPGSGRYSLLEAHATTCHRGIAVPRPRLKPARGGVRAPDPPAGPGSSATLLRICPLASFRDRRLPARGEARTTSAKPIPSTQRCSLSSGTRVVWHVDPTVLRSVAGAIDMKSSRVSPELEQKLSRAAAYVGLTESELIRQAVTLRCEEILGGALDGV